VKALVISPQPFFSPRGTPFSVYYRTLVTSELGVKIDLLTYGEGDDVDIPNIRIIRIPRFAALGNVKTGPSVLKLFLDVFMLFWTIALLLRNRYDFVHAHEEAVFYCRFLKPIFRFKLVYDMHSSLPQQLSNFKFTTSKFLIDVFKKMEDACLEYADAVITICPDLAEYALDHIEYKEKHFLIENSIFETVKLKNVRTAQNIDMPEYVQGFNIKLSENKKFIVYAGTLERYQGIDILIDSFHEVVNKCADVFLLIVGGDKSQVDKYSLYAEKKGLIGKIIFTGRVEHSVAKYFNSIASVIASPRCAGTNTPLKIYELLASGIPIVATNIYSHTQVLNDSVAYLVEPEAKDLARGIIDALKQDHEHDAKVKNAKSLYEQKYSREIYVEKMKQLLKLLSKC